MPSTPTIVLDELAAPRESVRVVLVEDNPGDALLVQEMLREAGDGAVLNTCQALKQAESPISAGLADLVLLDLSLPDAHGLDGLHRLRSIAPDVPVVVLSALNDDRVALEAVQAGAQDYLMKDRVDPPALSKAIRYALERQRSERRHARLALRDALTSLPNRVLFADRLEQTIARGLRRSTHPVEPGVVLLMLVDVDGFAELNARAGHATGDRLLIELAARLREHLREGDTVARLGGDEFVILCEDVLDDAAGLALAERLATLVGVPSAVAPGVTLSVSIGVAVADPGVEGGGDLLLRADTAVHAAKRIGPGRCAMADPVNDPR